MDENRFNDASYYYWMLSNEYLQVACDEPNDSIRAKSLRKFYQFQHLAEIYYVYQHLHSYVVCFYRLELRNLKMKI